MSLTSAPATLLLASSFVAVIFSVTFFMAHRRHPGVAGPGWWALAGALGALAFGGFLSRIAAGGDSLIGLANSALVMAALACWLGVRSHLGMAVRTRWVMAACTVVLVGNAIVFSGPWPGQVRPASLMLWLLVVFAASLVDLLRRPGRLRHNGVTALVVLTAVELIILLLLGQYAAAAPEAGRFNLTSEAVGVISTGFFAASLLRLVVYLGLVSCRLQEQHDAAQQTTRQREAESWELLECLQAGVMSLDADGRILRSNTLARQLLGVRLINGDTHEPDRLSALRWLNTSGRSIASHEAPHHLALHRRSPVRDTLIGVPGHAPDDTRWLLCNALHTVSREPHDSRVVVTFVDMTDVRRAQVREQQMVERHAQAQRMEALGTLASGVAHDFNNILAAIQGHIALLRQDFADIAETSTTLRQMDKAAQRGRSLVGRILAFGRQQGVSWQTIDVLELLQDTVNLLSAVRRPGVVIDWQDPGPLPDVLGDATQLTQVLLNLGTNAVQALGAAGGRVQVQAHVVQAHDVSPTARLSRLRWRPLQRLVRIVVLDNGCGMDDATLSKMFEPFFTTKPPGEGTGLGLAAVRSVVERHGGDIDVQSALGEGTRVTLWLPAAGDFSDSVEPAQHKG
jgi:signal transduction histidine kinase